MKVLSIATLLALCFSLQISVARAQDFLLPPDESLLSTSAAAATASTTIQETSTQTVRASDLTQQSGAAADRLESVVLSRELGALSPLNFLQHAVLRAVHNGISATTIAFLLLFPIIASLIAFARHVVGLSGLSMYAPAALAVALLSLGIVRGSIVFVAILLLALIGKQALSGLKLPYLPRTAMILWGVSLGTFLLLVASTYFSLFSFSILNVFALLILILLSESFLEIAAVSSPSIAMQRVIETFILGLLCSLVLGSTYIQTMVVSYPEITMITICCINLVIGRYLGLRFTEWLRFRQLSEEQE